jgi:hypothetical protein
MGKEMLMAREPGPGEAAERATRRRWMSLLAISLVVGALSGMIVALTTHGDGGFMGQKVPIWAAVLLTAGWLGTMGYGAWYYETQVDEVERNANYYGYAVGGGLVVVVYPVWYIFWWAGAVREPTHEALMGLLFVGALAGYLWKKYR